MVLIPQKPIKNNMRSPETYRRLGCWQDVESEHFQHLHWHLMLLLFCFCSYGIMEAWHYRYYSFLNRYYYFDTFNVLKIPNYHKPLSYGNNIFFCYIFYNQKTFFFIFPGSKAWTKTIVKIKKQPTPRINSYKEK